MLWTLELESEGDDMTLWLNLGQHLKVNAKRYPNTIAVKDRLRSYTYPE